MHDIMTNVPIYQLKISLQGCKPPIWRRVQVAGNTTLGELHDIIQIAMGWTDSHLHQFIIAGECYGTSDIDAEFDVLDERKLTLLNAVGAPKGRFVYEYDFGDSWRHDVLVEKILPVEAKAHYPRCLTGKRACPPEDCGGVWGYADLLKTLNDPRHPEHEEMLEWLGGDWDPEEFSLDIINAALLGRRGAKSSPFLH
jgi:hypothetical protein